MLNFKWLALILVMITSFVVISRCFSAKKLALSRVEELAFQLAGPKAINCGHLPMMREGLSGTALRNASMKHNSLWNAIDACAVAAFRAGKPFRASYDGREAGFLDSAAPKRVILLGTPDGKILILECYISVPPSADQEVVLKQRECLNPVVRKRNGLKAPEYISCQE